MSDNDKPELSGVAQAVSDTIPVEKQPTEFAYTQEHTPANTPMKERQEPIAQSKKELDEKDLERGYSTVFMGTNKKDILDAQQLVGRWLSVTSVRDLRKRGRASESLLNGANNDWLQYVETNFPGKTAEEIEEKAIAYYRFFDSVQSDLLLRTRLVHEEDLTNVSKRSSKLTITDILGRVPGAETKGFSISEVMARSTARATNTPHQYTVLCRNSFLQFTFLRPNKLEMGDLINTINGTVRGYVRQVSNNSVVIASVAGMKAVWNWLAPRIVSSSVAGVIDFKELGNLIRVTDFHIICNAILASVTDNGIGMDLRCVKSSCNHSSYQLVDPTRLSQIRPSIETAEESAIYGNIGNGRVSYTADQVLALIEQSTYGLPDNKIYNKTQNICLTIAPCSFNDAFVTFDYFIGEIDPQLAAIRSKVVDENTLQEQIAIVLNSLGACEFIQWVDTFTIYPEDGGEGEPVVLRRSECNPDEFNKGLMRALRTDDVLNKNMTLFVYNKSPYMTRTFTGIRNQQCPQCGTSTDSIQEEERKLGYTPIDPFMTFFTHTQLMLMDLAVANQEVTKEALL